MIAVDLGHERDLVRTVAVMRQRMVRLVHANLRVYVRVLFAADHERDDPRQVALKRQELQVQHQPHVLFKTGRSALRLLQ